jgi:transcriptional regulator with GAF, ATPase, and Fis domain
MPPALQVKMLRVLEDQFIVRVGDHHEREVDVRIIAATNVDLLQKMDETGFRKDLYYRLAGFTIHVAPLRQRREDIPLLAHHFLGQLSSEMKIDPPIINAQALAKLLDHPFFGNVRELKNTIEHALILCDGAVILPEHLKFTGPSDGCQDTGYSGFAGGARPSFGGHAPVAQRTTLSADQIKSIMIKGALVEEDGNIAAAARLLNICPDQVQRVAGFMDTAGIGHKHPLDEERIVHVLRKGGTINNAECRRMLNVNLHRASYLLKKMNREGVIKKERSGRWTRYRLAQCTSDSTLIDDDDCELNANR